MGSSCSVANTSIQPIPCTLDPTREIVTRYTKDGQLRQYTRLRKIRTKTNQE